MSDLQTTKTDTGSKFINLLIELGFALFSILVALLVGTVFILLAGESPLDAYHALYIGSIGSWREFLNTLWRATPLIFTGFALALPFKAGLFNIGGEGQLLVGGFAAGFVGFYFTGLPSIIHVPLAILAAMAAGALWGLIPGLLKAYKGAHEVITTIMLNYIAIQLTIRYGIDRFRTGGRQALPTIEESARLVRFVDMAEMPIIGQIPLIDVFALPGLRLHLNFILALISAAVLWYLLFKTTVGYEIRAVGFNSSAAEYGGISSSKTIILSMVIAGALAGLAGAGEALGTHHTFMSGMDADLGFTGIAVALLGRNHPFGIVLAGILFGGLTQGGLEMQFAGIPSEIVTIIQALVIFFVAGLQMLKWFLLKRREKGETE